MNQFVPEAMRGIGPFAVSPNQSDAIVAQHKTGHDAPDAVDYYGGHLVAEAVYPQFRSLLAAAPVLFAAVCEAEAFYEAALKDAQEAGDAQSAETWSERLKGARAAMALAMGVVR